MAPKAPPHTSYASLSQIEDPVIRQVVKLLFDKIAAVEQVTPNIGLVSQPLDTHLNANGNLVQQLGDPQAATDAVNLQTLQRYVAAAIKAAVP